jgi:DNA-binding XRE family transcriptional regulator
MQLKQIRERAALSQGELAERAGVRRQTVVAIEKGHSEPHMRTVRALARALGVQPVALMGDADG